ncbi:DUF6912 family protein [Allosalinactinospora lopnorensis]|uniref:DUF6912 family protein n=1 Tax=Allosalinactinospora lopnorensis TaxID=1352348 RepID=UPI000623DA11|nr:hypothetical protein [Allosalinactinospora lopnorensis]
MRIFLPSTLPALAGVLADGSVRGAPITAFAVTRELSNAQPVAGEEELEYEAMLSAADASLQLLAADPDAPRRRVVLAADVPDRIVEPAAGEAEPSAVAVAGEVPLKRIASAHVDDEATAPAIEAAIAEPGTGHEYEHELMWYATQELKYLFD